MHGDEAGVGQKCVWWVRGLTEPSTTLWKACQLLSIKEISCLLLLNHFIFLHSDNLPEIPEPKKRKIFCVFFLLMCQS